MANAAIRILDEPDRYRLLKLIRQGGMGDVYKFLDEKLGKEVAIKTLRDRPTEKDLQMFRNEIQVLAKLDDDNIVQILNIGECEHYGLRKPYLVMPFLDGCSLDQLIGKESLSVERSVRIILQVCHGLDAAHSQSEPIIHRDIKPSNIFVRKNGRVKIIDFGLARIVDTRFSSSRKGTERYMSPEQLDGRALDARSDLFSLGIVFYEVLTRQHPFDSGVETHDAASAIRYKKPPLVKDLNPDVSDSLCCVVHKALQKDTRYRFQSAKSLADDLEKALRNEPLDYCNSSKIEPVISEVWEELRDGRLEVAADLLDDLESRGYWHPKIEKAREAMHKARREREARQLLEKAREYLDAGRLDLAQNTVGRVLALEPENREAREVTEEIQRRSDILDIERWLEAAETDLRNQNFDHAEQKVQNVLKTQPNHAQAISLQQQIRKEKDEFGARKRREEEKYQKVLRDKSAGNISSAYHHAEDLLALIHLDRDPDPRYLAICQQISSDHDFLLRKLTEVADLERDERLKEAIALCEEVLRRYPNDIGFKARKTQIETRQLLKRATDVANRLAQANAEHDLDRRIEILEEGLGTYPDEVRLEKALTSARDLRQVVKGLVETARDLERQGDFEGAIDQYQTLQRIYPLHSDVNFQIKRLEELRRRALVIEEIKRNLDGESFEEARLLAQESLHDFPGDPEIGQLLTEAEERIRRQAQIEELCDRAIAHSRNQQFDKAVGLLEEAERITTKSSKVKALLIENLLSLADQQAHSQQRRSAEETLQKVLLRDPKNERAKALLQQIRDQIREESVSHTLRQAKELQSEGRLDRAIDILDQELRGYPDEARIIRYRDELTGLRDENLRKTKVAEVHARVDKLKTEGQPEKALVIVEDTLAKYPEEETLLNLQSSLKEALEERRKQKEVANAIETIRDLEQGNTLPRLRQALSMAASCLQTHPREPALLECQTRLEKEIEEAISQIERCRDSANECLREHEYAAALTQVDKALEINPQDQQVVWFKRRIQVQQFVNDWIDKSRTNVKFLWIGGATAAILLLGILTLHRILDRLSPEFAQVSIDSLPPGARVYIGDEEKGSTPVTFPLPVPRKSSRQVLLKLVSENYETWEESLILSPNGRFEKTFPLKRKGASPAGAAYANAERAYGERRLVPPEPDCALMHIETAVELDPENQEGFKAKALSLRGQIKTDLKNEWLNLPTNEKKSERERLLLERLSIVDPNDPEVIAELSQFPEMIQRLRRKIDEAMTAGRLLKSEAGSALSLLAQLTNSFPNEQSYYRNKRRQVLLRVRDVVATRCPSEGRCAGDDCQRYVESALRDFPNDNQLKQILSNASESCRRPDEPGPKDPTYSQLRARVQQLIENMEQSYNKAQHVLPRTGCTVSLANEIIALVRNDQTLASESQLHDSDVYRMVRRAEDLKEEGYRRAVQDAEQLASVDRFSQALNSAAGLPQAKQDFEKAKRIQEAIHFFRQDAASRTAIAEINRRLQDLNSLSSQQQYEVFHLHSLGKCNGLLSFTAYGIRHSAETANDGFDKRYEDLLDFSRDGDKVELKFSNRTYRFRFRGENAAQPQIQGGAQNIVDSIKFFRELRQRLSQQGQP
jgi:serine/threonine protein kinase